jgi:hypothetical protein
MQLAREQKDQPTERQYGNHSADNHRQPVGGAFVQLELLSRFSALHREQPKNEAP